MANDSNLPERFSMFEWRILIPGLIISATLLMVPFFIHDINSIAYLLFTFFNIFLLLMVMMMSFSEYVTTFPKSCGGVFTYLSSAYNRYVGFSLSIITYLSVSIFLISIIYHLLSIFYPVFHIKVLIIISIIALTHALLAFLPRHITVFIIIFSIAGFLGAVGLIAFGIFNFDISVPLIDDISFTGFSFLNHFFVILGLSFIPFMFCVHETSEIEEDIPTFLIPLSKRMFFIFPIIILFYLSISHNPGSGFYDYSGMFSGLRVNGLIDISALILAVGLFIYWMSGFSRFFFSLSQEGLFFNPFSKVHPGLSVPLRGIILQLLLLTAVTMLIPLIDPAYIIGLVSLNMLVVIGLLGIGIASMKYLLPNIERPYSIKHWKTTSFIMLVYVVFGLLSWYNANPAGIILVYMSFLAALFVPYYLLEMYYNEGMSTLTRDLLCYLAPAYQKLTLSKGTQDIVFDFLGNLKDKTVLDYGCSTGAMTYLLSEKVGLRGRIYASDKSKKSLTIAKKRLKDLVSQGYNIQLIQDTPSSVSPLISQVNCIVSIGNLSALKDVDYVIKGLNMIIITSSKIAVVEYDKYFFFFRNKWLSDDSKIRDVFDRNGFGITIQRKWGFFFQYVIITGIKFKNAYYMDTWYQKKEFS